MTLFERVKEISKTKGFSSLQTLSEEAGLSPNVVYGWKSKKPSASSLQKVADVLGVSVDYLLGNTDEMHPADNRTVEQKLSDEGMAIATYIDPNAELDEQAMDNIKKYIYEQTMLAKMRIDKERAKNGK